MSTWQLGWVAVALAALAGGARADEAKALAALEKLRAAIVRDDNQPGKPVVEVYLGGSKVTDAGLKELKELKSLQTLTLFYTKVTAAGLKELMEALPNLEIQQ